MIPSETVVGRVEEMYDPERMHAILAQFEAAQGTVGTETLIGQLSDQPLEPGWYLEITERGFPTRMIRLSIGEHLIGRSSACNIIIQHRCVSRMHCMMTIHADGRVVLRDLQSANHTVVNTVQMESEGRLEVSAGAIMYLSYFCCMILRQA